jgi:hypothetical protein
MCCESTTPRGSTDRCRRSGGKTPRVAARTRAGRHRVDALLRDIENHTGRMPGGDQVDFGAMRRTVGLGALPSAGEYDARQTPVGWLALDESERLLRVVTHHEKLPGHSGMPNPRLHASMHVIVENQLAAGDPPEVRATLERLLEGGCNRHEAIHALASVVAEDIFRALKEKRAWDRDHALASLAALRPEGWAGTVG